MRQRKMLKKVTSIMCAMALVVTSITAWDVTKAGADTATTIYQTNDEGRAELLNEVRDENINFALNKEASVSKLTTQEGGTDLGIITNGKFDNGNSKTTIIEIGRTVKEDRWVQVDLGAAYDTSKIDRVVAMYKTLNSGPTTATVGTYLIQYSLNGMDYVDIAEVSGIAGATNAIYLDKISMTDEQSEAIPYARYVRIYATRDLSAYGMQIKGMAVLTDGVTQVGDVDIYEVEKPEEPTSLTVTSSDYGQLEYVFESAEGHDDYTYYAYIDGSRDSEPKTPGEKYIVSGLDSGNHTVKIVSFKEGVISDGITESVQISTPKELIETDRNIALGKTAISSSTRVDIVNEEEVPDDITKLTDGKLNTQFRTLQTDAQANIVIDLGANYKLNIIEMIAIAYLDNRYAQEYSIDYSEDGENFEIVCTATGNSTFQYSKINSEDCTLSSVRYVRVNVSKPVAAAYGFQFYEIAVITKELTLDDTDISLSKSEYTYTGEEIIPDVMVTFGDKTLEMDKDYTLSCKDNVDAGTAAVVLEGAGSYSGMKELEYTIVPASMDNTVVSTSFDDNGELQVSVSYNEKELENGKDYTYTTEKNEDGDMLVTVKAAGNNFVGTTEKVVPLTDFPVSEVANVSVTSTEVNKVDVTFENPDTFAGDGQVYDVYLDGTLVGENVAAGTYTYDRQNAGEHTVKVVAKLNGQTTEGVENKVTVKGKDISKYLIEIGIPELTAGYIYNGTSIVPECSIINEDQTETLQENVDYTIAFEDNINAGEAKIIVTGIGLYEGVLEGTFTIEPKDIENIDIDLTQVEESYAYRGTPIEPVISIEGLELDVDYTVVISENVNPGVAKIVITGIGNYKGEITKEFTIVKKNVKDVLVQASYQGKELVVSVTDSHHQMVKDVDYKYTVVEDAKGNVTITVEGIGDCFEGTIVKTIAAKDNPNAPTTAVPTTPQKTTKELAKTKVTAASKKKATKKVKITFKRVTGAKKYQVQISKTKKFKKVLVKKTVKKVKVTISSKKIKNKKKLYVRVKAVGAKKWSKAKKIKIKK